MTRARALVVLLLLAAFLVAVRWQQGQGPGSTSSFQRNVGGPLTVAATGDVLFSGALPASDAGFAPVAELLRGATVAMANLEATLLSPETTREVAAQPLRGPIGTARDVRALVESGVNAIVRANNHSADYGEQGISETDRILADAGLASAGAGADLDRARAPLFLELGAHRVAVLSVTASSRPEARALRSRGDIEGRPGVNALRFTADITVDADSYRVLSESAIARAGGAGKTLDLFGTTISKGDKTAVIFRADPQDVAEMIDQIKKAKAQADAVILNIHSHEPSNYSESPADFVRDFAHAAIDAGAALVVGHGPHQLRGVERYGEGMILHSLGNFIFKADAVSGPQVDVFDAGIDLYQMTLGTVSGYDTLAYDEDVWWESVIAEAAFENGRLTSLRLHPIDLGIGMPASQRGMPKIAEPARAAAILERIARLSGELGTMIRIDGGVGEWGQTPTP